MSLQETAVYECDSCGLRWRREWDGSPTALCPNCAAYEWVESPRVAAEFPSPGGDG